MVDALIRGVAPFLEWPYFLYPIAGTLLGMVFGVIPGIGGITAMALLVPFTFKLGTVESLMLLSSALGGVAFAGSITAILLNIPGTAPNAATCLDGYPMARQGRAGEALGAAATASALGALFGIILLVTLLPIGKQIILSFSFAEIFMLSVLGLSVIAVVSQGSVLKGLTAAGLGLMISFVGFDSLSGDLRYIPLEAQYLWDGVKPIPAFIGLFAIAEVLRWVVDWRQIMGQERVDAHYTSVTHGVLKGAKAVFSNWFLFLRSSLIGWFIGVIPAVGGVTANFLSYLQALQTCKNPETFGRGDVRGVIASESGNDAKDGGALIPTLVFGIPGSPAMVLLYAGLILHGLQPGLDLLLPERQLDKTFVLIFSLGIANVLTSLIGLLVANHLARLARIHILVMAPIVLVLSLFGVYAVNQQFGDVLTTVAFGLLGYMMKKHGYPVIAIAIALILGLPIERAFRQALTISTNGYWTFFTRPISLCLFLASITSLLLPFFQAWRQRRRHT